MQKHDPGPATSLLLAYDRNGTHGTSQRSTLRLIVPGYYGIANVKWLTRIELRDRCYMGRYMARDYVTVRAEERDGALTHVETSGTHEPEVHHCKVTHDHPG